MTNPRTGFGLQCRTPRLNTLPHLSFPNILFTEEPKTKKHRRVYDTPKCASIVVGHPTITEREQYCWLLDCQTYLSSHKPFACVNLFCDVLSALEEYTTQNATAMLDAHLDYYNYLLLLLPLRLLLLHGSICFSTSSVGHLNSMVLCLPFFPIPFTIYAAATPILYRAACYYVKVQFRKFKLQDKMTHTVKKKNIKKRRSDVHMHTMIANKSVCAEEGERL